jgi:hypothetical protein
MFTGSRLRRWLVFTPEYSEVIAILDDGSGPIEYGCDVIEVEAETRRDAIAFGVKLMLAATHSKYPYVHDARSDKVCPYTGVRAELVEDEQRE